MSSNSVVSETHSSVKSGRIFSLTSFTKTVTSTFSSLICSILSVNLIIAPEATPSNLLSRLLIKEPVPTSYNLSLKVKSLISLLFFVEVKLIKT